MSARNWFIVALALAVAGIAFLVTKIESGHPETAASFSQFDWDCKGDGDFSFSLNLGIMPVFDRLLLPDRSWLLIQPAIVVRSAPHARHFEQLYGSPSNKVAYGHAEGIFVFYYIFVRPGILGNEITSSRYHNVETSIEASRAFVKDFQVLCESELRNINSPAELLEWGGAISTI